MKKRSFLLPIAAATAALVTTGASAMTPPSETATSSLNTSEFAPTGGLVLERSAAPTVKMADHASHSSHASHASHASSSR